MARVSKMVVVIALLLTLLIGFGYSRVRRFAPRQREIDQQSRTIEEAEREVKQKGREADEKEAELKAMESDPSAREAAARQGLRWVREGEKVFIVEEPWEVVPAGDRPTGLPQGTAAPEGPLTQPDRSGPAAAQPPSVPELMPLVPLE